VSSGIPTAGVEQESGRQAKRRWLSCHHWNV